MPIAITEWGPNTVGTDVVIPASTVDHGAGGIADRRPVRRRVLRGFMDQGAMAAHWLELHNNSYLAGVDATNDPFTMANDSRAGATTPRSSRTSSRRAATTWCRRRSRGRSGRR